MVTRRIGQILLYPQVPLGRLDRRMAERELDLFDGGVALVGQLGEGAPQIVGGDLYVQLFSIPDHDGEDRLRRHSPPRHAAALVDWPQQPPGGDAGGGGPAVDRGLGPGGHRHGADPLSLPRQVEQDPARVPLLDRRDFERGEFFAPQAAAEEDGQQRPVAFSPQGIAVGQGKQLFGLRPVEPVAGAGAAAGRPFDPADRGRVIGRAKPVVVRFADQFADGAQPDVDRGRGQAGGFERNPVALDRGFVKAVRRLDGAPGPKMFERVVVSPPGMGRDEAFEGQRGEVVARGGAGREDFGRPVRDGGCEGC